ncbi:MAG: hypothetical protein HC877_18810 [Thioploca sp.]|nr:hypothetical protein [Thioploca sp.]
MQVSILRNFICQADYKSLENRTIAILSGDPTLIKWFQDDVDVHIETAKILFDIDKVTTVQRELSKQARYGFHYGATLDTVYEQISGRYPDISLRDVKRLYDKLKQLHPVLAAYLDEAYNKAVKRDYIEEPFSGYRYQCYGKVEPPKSRNLPNQMAAAYLMNKAANKINNFLSLYPFLGTNDLEESILMQVHDSFLLEGPDPFRLFDILKNNMEQDATLMVIQLDF